MSAEVFVFEEFANSGRGLLCRPVMPNDKVALLSHIQSITYEVYNLTDGGAPVIEPLVPANVMFETAQPWKRDKKGYTFRWPAPGTLWALADKQYRVIVKFTQTVTEGGLSFMEVWEVRTKSPSG